jgi:hypothetical protein
MNIEKGKIIFENGSEINILSGTDNIRGVNSKKIKWFDGLDFIFKRNPDNYGIPEAPRVPMPECKPPKVDYDYIKNISHLIEIYKCVIGLGRDMKDSYSNGADDILKDVIVDLEKIIREEEV